jgi:class 3 adenylate cyclase
MGVGEARRGLKGRRRDGTLFQMVLKGEKCVFFGCERELSGDCGGARAVHEYVDATTRIFIGVVRDVSKSRQANDYLALLEQALPRDVIPKLLGAAGASAGIAERYRATVGFIELLDYTQLSSAMPPMTSVRLLAEIWQLFDQLLDECECERVKTIGPCYMYVSCLVAHVSAHAINGTLFAQRCVEALSERGPALLRKAIHKQPGQALEARAGVATGELIAGVVAGERLAYDVFGSTVNLASRLEHQAKGALCMAPTVFFFGAANPTYFF